MIPRKLWVVTVIALISLAAVCWGTARLLSPVTIEWNGEVKEDGKKVSLVVTRILVQQWSNVDTSTDSVADILRRQRKENDGEEYFLYVEYRFEGGDNAQTKNPLDRIESDGPMVIEYDGQELRFSGQGAMTEHLQEGDRLCELRYPIEAPWPGIGNTISITEHVSLEDGSEEEFEVSIALKE